MKKLNGLEFVPRATSHMGALEGCLNFLGLRPTPGWLFGSTGHAFVLICGKDLCPSGPHCWRWSTVHELGHRLGYACRGIYTNRNQPDCAAKQQEAWKLVRAAIDEGTPCYGWHYDFMVITGYDDHGYLLDGPNPKAPGDWQKFGLDAVGFLDIWMIRPAKPADDATTIAKALSFAANFHESNDTGLGGYDNWAAGLESGKGDPFGAVYHAAIWAECRRYAQEFLEEANRRTRFDHVDLFAPAIAAYRRVSANLDRVEQLFPYKSATKDQWNAHYADAARRQQAAGHVRVARAAEAEGLSDLARLAEVLQAEAHA